MQKSNWNATAFFENLVDNNKLAQTENFTFCQVSGLEGFEEALQTVQSASAFVCVSDIADGYTELNNTPRTRRIKTVFLAMRHAVDDMDARTDAQKASLVQLITELRKQFPNAKVYGHKDFANKACPCFDAQSEYKNL